MFKKLCIGIGIFATALLFVAPETASAEETRIYYFPIVMNTEAVEPDPEPVERVPSHNKRLRIGVTVRDTEKLKACDEIAFDYYHDWRYGYQNWPEVPECGFHVPFLWCTGDSAETYDEVHGLGAAARYSGTVYFANEPSLHDQCASSPEEIARYYLQIREEFPNAELVGPNVMNMGGVHYFQEWWTALVEISGTTDHDLQGVGLHLYASMIQNIIIVEELGAYLESIGQDDTPIHITEFSVMTNDSQRNEPEALVQFLDYLEENERVEAVYYWANVAPCSRSDFAYNFPSTYLIDCDGKATMYLNTIKEWLQD